MLPALQTCVCANRCTEKMRVWSSHCHFCVSVLSRMNNGPVIGYEEDVGRRTTFRLSYPESIFSDPIHYDPNTTVVIIVFKPRDLKWLWEILGGQKIVSVITYTFLRSACHVSLLWGTWFAFNLSSPGWGPYCICQVCSVSLSLVCLYPFSLPHLISSSPQSSVLGNFF